MQAATSSGGQCLREEVKTQKCIRRIRLYSGLAIWIPDRERPSHGSLALSSLDLGFHLWRRLCFVPHLRRVGLRLGAGLAAVAVAPLARLAEGD